MSTEAQSINLIYDTHHRVKCICVQNCSWKYFTIHGSSYWKGINIKIFLMTVHMKWMNDNPIIQIYTNFSI